MSEEIITVTDRPPNFEAIRAVFPGACGEGVVFAYGNTIYNPSGLKLPPELVAHEIVHCERQLAMGVEAWWDRYLVDGQFRFEEELLAHIAEFKSIMSKYSYKKHAIGRVRQKAIEHVAHKLAAPLYDRMVTVHQAITAIRKGAAA
jgi:hypothetical protein